MSGRSSPYSLESSSALSGPAAPITAVGDIIDVSLCHRHVKVG
jgi:hypothetical protein